MKKVLEYAEIGKFMLSDSEAIWMEGCMEFLEESFRALEGIDTGDVKPLFTVLDIKNLFREDVLHKMLSRDELLSNAPERHEGYFQVPKTL